MSYSEQPKLSNNHDGLHNFSDTSESDMYRINYLFLTQMPMYVALEQKYKESKRKVREQRKMIELLNRQNMDIMERYANRTPLFVDQSVSLSDTFSKLHSVKLEPVAVPCPRVLKENITYKEITSITIEEDTEDEEATEETEDVEVEVEATQEVHVEVEQEEQETEEVEVEQETEEVEQEEQETEEVEVEQEEETEETEEVEVEQEEETEEEVEVEEEEEVEETEEVEQEEVEETEETEEVEETEEEQEEVEEEGVYEITIKGKKYYTTNEVNGTIYAILPDEDIGDEVGSFVNSKAVFHKK